MSILDKLSPEKRAQLTPDQIEAVNSFNDAASNRLMEASKKVGEMAKSLAQEACPEMAAVSTDVGSALNGMTTGVLAFAIEALVFDNMPDPRQGFARLKVIRDRLDTQLTLLATGAVLGLTADMVRHMKADRDGLSTDAQA